MNKLDPLVAALLGGGLITGIVALVGHFVTLWNSEQEARRQREIENEREQVAALQEYINNMRALVTDLVSLRDVDRGTHLDIYGAEYEVESEHEPLAKETPKHKAPLLQRLERYRLQLRRYLERISRDQVAEEQGSTSQQELTSHQEAALRVGESQTIAVLLSVTGRRKRVPITLVHRLALIKWRRPVLDLRDADLMHADLTEVVLQDASLILVNLRGANLSGADLSGSDLRYADLRGVNLTNADLSAANLSGANLLPYDEYEPARLSFYNLKGHALPSEAYLRSLAKLQEERLRGLSSRLTRRVKNRLLRRKPVTFTNLTDVKLDGANLTGALLANADLRYTRGSLDRKQIERAIGNDKTKLPDTDEFKQLPPKWISKGIEQQIWEIETQVREERIKNVDEQI
jgi:hypothetical protein